MVCKRLRDYAHGKDQARSVDSSICQPGVDFGNGRKNPEKIGWLGVK